MVRHSRSRASLRGTPLGRWSLSRLRSAKDWLPVRPRRRENTSFCKRLSDPQTDVAPGRTRGRNVRSKNQCSMCPAIHTKSRSWLRSSSTREPSDPLLRVVTLEFADRDFSLSCAFEIYRETLRPFGRRLEEESSFTETSPALARLSGRTGLLRAAQGRHRVERTYEAALPIGSPLRA